MATIGIVTVLYNSETVLKDFFKSLGEQTYLNFKLYIIDNNSSDNSLQLAKNLSANADFECSIISESENWGIAKGNNIGIRAALKDGCEYVLLSNNDIILEKDAIEQLLFEMNDSIVMTTSKIYYHGSNTLWYAGGKIDFLGRIRHFGDGEKDNGKYDNCKLTNYAPTCFMLLKKDVFNIVGLMDEKYFVYYDDCDFIHRAVYAHNQKLKYVPKSVIHHKISISTGGKTSSFAQKMNSRNAIYFFRKNLKFPYKQIAILWSWINNFILKPLKYDKSIVKIAKESYWEGFKMRLD